MALAQFARTSHIDIIYRASPASAQSSPAVTGVYTPTEVLNLLLKDSGLAWRYTRSDAVLIYDPALPAEEEAPAPRTTEGNEAVLRLDTLNVRSTPLIGRSQAQFNTYAHAAMTRINGLLAPRAVENRHIYRATLHLWLQEDGVIDHTALTGTIEPVAAEDISATITGLRLDPPPAGMPQPIRFIIEARQ